MNATEILVIILSVFLALFLLIGIVLGIFLIRVTLQIKKVTSSAERTVEGIEAAVSNISRVSSQAFIGRMIMKHVKKLRKKR